MTVKEAERQLARCDAEVKKKYDEMYNQAVEEGKAVQKKVSDPMGTFLGRLILIAVLVGLISLFLPGGVYLFIIIGVIGLGRWTYVSMGQKNSVDQACRQYLDDLRARMVRH